MIISLRPSLLPMLFLAFLVSACGKVDETPEDRVRNLIASAEKAVESKDLSPIKEMIAEDYYDGRGNDRQSLLGILRYHFLRYEALHLLIRIDTVRFPSPDTAEVTVIAALAGEPIPTVESLESLRADVYRFDIILDVKDQESLQLRQAAWQRASTGDIF